MWIVYISKAFSNNVSVTRKFGKFANVYAAYAREKNRDWFPEGVTIATAGSASDFPLRPRLNFDKTSRPTVIMYHFVQYLGYRAILKVYNKKSFV